MKLIRTLVGLSLCSLALPLASAQTGNQADYRRLLREYMQIRSTLSVQKRVEMDQLFRTAAPAFGVSQPSLPAMREERIAGLLSANPYLPNSTASAASRYSPTSPANPYGVYGSPYSPTGARNPYAVDGLDIVGQDGTYLGKLNSNRYDPNSVANTFGPYGSPYSPTSVNNPYSPYGSPYSPHSAVNPYAVQPPLLLVPRSRLPALPGLPTLPDFTRK
jgi:hypothetical protein